MLCALQGTTMRFFDGPQFRSAAYPTPAAVDEPALVPTPLAPPIT